MSVINRELVKHSMCIKNNKRSTPFEGNYMSAKFTQRLKQMNLKNSFNRFENKFTKNLQNSNSLHTVGVKLSCCFCLELLSEVPTAPLTPRTNIFLNRKYNVECTNVDLR